MFACDLLSCRKSLGMTQQEFGRLCGFSASAIGMMEQGRRKITKETENRLKQIYCHAMKQAVVLSTGDESVLQMKHILNSIRQQNINNKR